ncbi:MAG: dTMP kinase [Spirochaetaceae bacterium]|nr:dTMP kinase [Spirochaetaceae bacterium]
MINTLNNFIVLEGLDGAGTTTQLKKLKGELDKIGYNSYITNEPTSQPIGKLVRSVLSGDFKTTPLALAILYSADREDHLNNEEYGIIKQIHDNKLVISDRYFYSSLAYQGVNCNFEKVVELNKDFPHPQILIYIKTPVEVCLSRIDSRGEKKEIFEKRGFLSQVNNNYNKVLENLPKEVNLITIDGTLSIEEITTIMVKEVKKILCK